jgi:hypothetical protein
MVSVLLKNEDVELIEEIRRARLLLLIEECGTIAALAQKLDRQPAQVSQWKNASIDNKSQKPRSMKSETARWIEQKTGKPVGWMDQPIKQGQRLRAEQSPANYSSAELTSEEKLLIEWFRKKNIEERAYFLSFIGIANTSDFVKSA